MPNHCDNLLKIYSNSVEEFEAFHELFMRYSPVNYYPSPTEKIFDKRNIPEEILEIEDDVKFCDALHQHNQSKEKPEDYDYFSFNNILPVPEEILKGGYSNSGYGYQSNTWGTKWDAYSQSYNKEEQTYHFQTAWSPPTPIFQKMSELFPNLVFESFWVEEDCLSGYSILKGGEWLHSERHNTGGTWIHLYMGDGYLRDFIDYNKYEELEEHFSKQKNSEELLERECIDESKMIDARARLELYSPPTNYL